MSTSENNTNNTNNTSGRNTEINLALAESLKLNANPSKNNDLNRAIAQSIKNEQIRQNHNAALKLQNELRQQSRRIIRNRLQAQKEPVKVPSMVAGPQRVRLIAKRRPIGIASSADAATGSVAPQQQSQTIGPLPVEVHNVPGNGDCFYNSILQACQNQNITSILERCIGKEATIQNLRNFISDTIPDENINGMFDTLYEGYKPNISLSEANRKERLNTYKLRKDAIAGWHISAFENSVKTTGTKDLARAEFYKRIKVGIKKMTNWADELEIRHLIAALNLCNIQINTFYTETPGNLYKKKDGVYQINLFNEGMVHFQFFKFITRGGNRIVQTRKAKIQKKSYASRKYRN